MAKQNIAIIEEIANVKGGKRLPAGQTLKKETTSHPYIRVLDMDHKNTIELKKGFEFINEQTHSKISKYVVRSGDIIISIVGTIGLVSYIGESLNGANLTENCMNVRVKDERFHPKYVFYFLTSYKGQQQIRNGIVGSVQPKLPMYSIKKIKIPLIPYDKQVYAVEKLESIEAKLNLNNELINKLEEYAHLLFYKWFVDFNFPNEQGKPYKDSGGKMVEVDGKVIPEGWKVKPLNDFVQNYSNGDWGETDWFEGGSETYCIRGADIPDIKYGKIRNTPVRFIKQKNGMNKTLRHGEIVIEASGGSPTQSTGRTVLIRDSMLANSDKPLYFSNFSKVITSHPNNFMFLYHVLNNLYNRHAFFLFEGKTSGIRNLLLGNFLNKMKFVYPDEEIMRRFEKESGVIWDKIFTIGHEIELLSETRDLLIKKLIK